MLLLDPTRDIVGSDVTGSLYWSHVDEDRGDGPADAVVQVRSRRRSCKRLTAGPGALARTNPAVLSARWHMDMRVPWRPLDVDLKPVGYTYIVPSV